MPHLPPAMVHDGHLAQVPTPALSTSLRLGIAATVALAAFAGVLVAGQEGLPAASRALSGAAFAIALALPVGVALLVARTCRPLLTACGVALIPRVVLSFSLLFFPLLWPATALIVTAAREPRCPRHGLVRHLAAGSVLVVLLIAPVIALFVTQDPVTYSLDNGSGSTSDTIAIHESVLSLSLSALAAGGALVLAGRPDPSAASGG
jgi:hypothetical protein